MARYILKGDKRAFPDKPRPNSLTNVWQAEYTEIPTLPPGGTTTQVLAKESNLDYDVKWSNIGAGTVTGANNGLSLLGLIAQLGGLLIKDTTIDGAEFNLLLENIGTLILDATSLRLNGTTSFLLTTPNYWGGTARSGQFLRLNNQASGSADWANLPNMDISLNPSTPFLSSSSHNLIIVDTTSGNHIVNLRTTPLAGDVIIVKKIDNSVNTVTITPGVGHTIDNTAGAILTLLNQSITMVFDGVSNWVVVSKYL